MIDRHAAIDYGHLAIIHFPLAKTIVLIQDNLNVHSKASLYEAFPAEPSNPVRVLL
jgi:hypothetical protein